MLESLDGGRVGHSRKRPLGRELNDVLPELLNQLLTLTLASGSLGDKVLKELGTGLLLKDERDLDGPVEEGGDGLHVLGLHRSRGEGRESDSDTTGNLGGGCARGETKTGPGQSRDL